jgi:hypothetical protein
MSNLCKPSAGVVYVATNEDRYVEEAFLSADSIKERYPDLSITLFTNRLAHPLCRTDRFDIVEPAADVPDFGLGSVAGGAQKWSEGQLSRLVCLRRTPYQHTLHLDTDTQIVTDELMFIFDLLNDVDVAMVETAIDDSYSRIEYGRPMFNAGMILYRRNDLTWAWLREWAALSERNFRWAGVDPLPRLTGLRHLKDEKVCRKLMCMDQISLVEILSPENNRFDLKVKVLDYSWNYRGSNLPEKNLEYPKILHLPRERVTDYAAKLEAAVYKTLTRMA